MSGKQQMKDLVEKFDRYTGMRRYSYALMQENVSIIDAQKIEERLYTHLQGLPNVQIQVDSEIRTFEKDKNSNVSILRCGYGQRQKAFECDAVVLCNGW